MLSVGGRVAASLLLALPIGGFAAALASVVSNLIFQPEQGSLLSNPVPFALLVSTFGAIILVPATLISQAIITVWQSKFNEPLARVQIIVSALFGAGLSALVMLAGKNFEVAQAFHSILTGLIGGAAIGWTWFLLVTAPTHQSRSRKGRGALTGAHNG